VASAGTALATRRTVFAPTRLSAAVVPQWMQVTSIFGAEVGSY
jgi:hypothetical protein